MNGPQNGIGWAVSTAGAQEMRRGGIIPDFASLPELAGLT
jgi:hypothetical protein